MDMQISPVESKYVECKLPPLVLDCGLLLLALLKFEIAISDYQAALHGTIK